MPDASPSVCLVAVFRNWTPFLSNAVVAVRLTIVDVLGFHPSKGKCPYETSIKEAFTRRMQLE